MVDGNVVENRIFFDRAAFEGRLGKSLKLCLERNGPKEVRMGETPEPTTGRPVELGAESPKLPGTDKQERTIDISIVGGRRLTGRWRPAKRLTSVSIVGGCHIDLSQAEIADGGITISRFALIGGTHVIVPDRIAVRLSGFGVVGGRRIDSRADPGPPGAPVVQLRVFSLVGGVKVESLTSSRR
jgi:hypothetical protein